MNIVNFGGGTNSAAMIYGMWQKHIPIHLILFADTGGERPETYRFIRIFNGWLDSRGLPEITRCFYRDQGGNRLKLETECLKGRKLPAVAYGMKQCSLKHKIGVQDKFCNHYRPCLEAWARGEKINKYIGYDAGEPQRVEHAAPVDAQNKKYCNAYPLVEWGWDRAKCREVLREAGFPQPGKSSCFFCPNMKKAEIRELWEKHPDLFQRAVALEHGAALTTVKGLGRDWSWADYHDAYVRGLPSRWYSKEQCVIDGFEEAAGGCTCGMPCGCYDG